MQSPDPNIKDITNNIWLTKKSRMNSEQRLKVYHYYSNFLIIYYAFLLICVNIVVLDFESFEDFEFNGAIELILSVGVFSLSIFTFASDFSGRAARYRECYLRLGQLTEQGLTPEDLKKSYDAVLLGYENHSPRDYEKIIIDNKIRRGKVITSSSGDDISFSKGAIASYYLRYFLRMGIAAIPLLLPVWLMLKLGLWTRISGI